MIRLKTEKEKRDGEVFVIMNCFNTRKSTFYIGYYHNWHRISNIFYFLKNYLFYIGYLKNIFYFDYNPNRHKISLKLTFITKCNIFLFQCYFFLFSSEMRIPFYETSNTTFNEIQYLWHMDFYLDQYSNVEITFSWCNSKSKQFTITRINLMELKFAAGEKVSS